MADLFVSYSRRDSDFVRRLCEALAAHGKDVWLDTETIADAEVFPEAIRRAIEECETFLFVITPASVESAYCEQEVDYAGELGKRIVPVLREQVGDGVLPIAIRDRNWIPFVDEAEFERSVVRVVTALDTDLDYRKRHTRWLVKAVEWERAHEDKSLLLRGSELSAAESWLAGAKVDADPPPTELQRSYLLRSRQANLRRQRRFAGAGLTVAALAVALLIFALISRGQAVTAESTASSRALAAQSANLLGTDPETSLLLGMSALKVSPTPDAMYAVRDALDRSTVRLALPTIRANGCYPEAAYNPAQPQILRATSRDLIAYSATSGRVQWRDRLKNSPDCALAFDSAQNLVAVGVGSSVRLFDPATGAATGDLVPSALRAAGSGAPVGTVGDVSEVYVNPAGTQVAVVTSTNGVAGSVSQLELWNLQTKTGQLVQPTVQIVDASFTADGSELLAGTEDGTLLRIDAADGSISPAVTVGGAGDVVTLAASPRGATVAVGDSPVSGATTTVNLWSSANVDAGGEPRLVRAHRRGRHGVQPGRDASGRRVGRRGRRGVVDGDAPRGGPAPRAGVADQLGVRQFRRAASPSLLVRRRRPRLPGHGTRGGLGAGDHVPRAVLPRLGDTTGVGDPGVGYADVRAGVLRAVLVLARRRDAEPASAERRPERPDCRERAERRGGDP